MPLLCLLHFLKKYVFLSYVSRSFTCIYVSVGHTHSVSLEARWGLGSSGIGVTEGCTRSCQCWELNSDSWSERQVLLAVELSL